MKSLVSLPYSLIVVFVLFPVLASLVLNMRLGRVRDSLFAIVNLGGAFTLCWLAHTSSPFGVDAREHFALVIPGFSVYVALVILNYWVLKIGVFRGGIWTSASIWAPLSLILLAKILPQISPTFLPASISSHLANFLAWFVGVSYLSFRLCLLAREVHNGVAQFPSLSRYLSFAFFVPTLSMGPISPYSKYILSLDGQADRSTFPFSRCAERIVVGLTKFLLLATVTGYLGYSGLLLDGHPHGLVDLLIAIPCFALSLYFNFSGYCDIVIGVSGLLGVVVIENFDRPFSARNFQEFWSRWHISLSLWFREMMFTPMVKSLGRRFGPKSMNHVIAFTICSVFIVLGIWHGANLHFALFGLSQGLGVAVVHYSTIYMKKRLGAKGFLAYRDNKIIATFGRVATFCYFALTLFLFANDFDQVRAISQALNMPRAEVPLEITHPVPTR